MAQPLVKATTPTSAGLAQVFDLSGFAEQAKEQQKERKQERLMQRERLNKTMLHYDPKGLMRNHVGAYQKLMEGYQKYVADNHSQLINSSENMEVWQGKTALENEIKSFTAGSMQMNQDFYRAGPMVLKDDSFINAENEAAMAGYLKEGTVEQFREGTLFQPIMQNLNRNYLVDEDKLVDSAREFLAPETELELGAEPGFDATRVTNRLDQKAFDTWSFETYNQKNRDGGDLRNKFKTLEEFQESISDRIVETEKVTYSRQRQETTKDPTLLEKKEANAISKVEGGSGILAQYGRETAQPTYDDAGKMSGTEYVSGTAQPTELYATDVYSVTAPTGKTGLQFTAQLKKGIDTRTGKEEDFPEGVTNFEVDKVAWMYRNTGTTKISIPTSDGGVQTVGPGEFLPNRNEIDPKMSALAWEQITLLHGLEQEQSARVRTVSDPSDLEQYVLSNIDTLRGEFGKEKTKEELMKHMTHESKERQWSIVPYGWVENDMREAYMIQYGVGADVYDERMKDFNDHPII